ncbi:ankyrin repeat domain-containing protein [Verminephrobacter aporrectodeae subsp. tuberculatae]|nr:ankyrin repeat domain-containing protein [Verminephrobacter aporrectodeae subsp. tuberculatae]MCW5289240.1 ankyrin repeat domain-containing protein [Verminephrobacter aporrectodeae subsp. tuberculatae]
MSNYVAFKSIEYFILNGFWRDAIEMVKKNPETVSILEKDNDDQICSLLYIASFFNESHDLMKILLEFGADPNTEAESSGGATPLGNSIYNSDCKEEMNNIENIILLVSAGADLRKFDEAGNTPLHAAVYVGRPDIVEFLLISGADPFQKNLYGDDIFEYIIFHQKSSRRMKDIYGDTVFGLVESCDDAIMKEIKEIIDEFLKRKLVLPGSCPP